MLMAAIPNDKLVGNASVIPIRKWPNSSSIYYTTVGEQDERTHFIGLLLLKYDYRFIFGVFGMLGMLKAESEAERCSTK